MARTQGGESGEGWKVGLLIAVIVLAGAGAGWGILWSLELPFAFVGGIVGAILAFVLFSYLYYGR